MITNINQLDGAYVHHHRLGRRNRSSLLIGAKCHEYTNRIDYEDLSLFGKPKLMPDYYATQQLCFIHINQATHKLFTHSLTILKSEALLIAARDCYHYIDVEIFNRLYSMMIPKGSSE